jgi:hypothetical protein
MFSFEAETPFNATLLPSKDIGMSLPSRSPELEGHSLMVSEVSLQPLSSNTGMARTKSRFSLSTIQTSDLSSSGSIGTDDATNSRQEEEVSMSTFGMALRHYLHDTVGQPIFDRGMRQVMEWYLRKARLEREKTRHPGCLSVDASIASSVGVPYMSLRQERPFLFDEHSFPLHTTLANALGISDLSRIHELGDDTALSPLLDKERRLSFHRIYDIFVTSFCIPLLHSMAIAKQIFHDHSRIGHDCITYRYQAFPSINVVRPGEAAKPPTCGVSQGHSVGCLFFHIPLTASQGTAALYVESYPGREDWHALQTKSIGLGFLFDGARCLQFGLEHTDASTSRVSLDFSIMIYREGCEHTPSYSSSSSSSTPFSCTSIELSTTTSLCTVDLLEDDFSRQGPGYYEEACVDLDRTIAFGTDAVIRKSRTLQEPDHRVGLPFLRH